MSDLTPKQELFVREYLADLNATQAAIRAGYSERGANKIGPRLLENPAIVAAIDAAKVERSEKTEITARRVLQEIATMAFYDPAQLIGTAREIGPGDNALEGEGIVSIDGKRYAISGMTSAIDILKLPEDVRRAIVGWGYDRNQNFTLKLADKSKALDQLARHLSLYNDKLEVTGLDALADRLARANARILDVPALHPATLPAPEATKVAAPEPVEPPKPAPAPSIAADWEAPKAPAPYVSPISWPEQPGQTECDYENYDDGFLSARRTT